LGLAAVTPPMAIRLQEAIIAPGYTFFQLSADQIPGGSRWPLKWRDWDGISAPTRPGWHGLDLNVARPKLSVLIRPLGGTIS